MKVSVVIPVYNAEKYLEGAVASALAQVETEEVLLVDDASTDSSLSVCQRLENTHERVRLLTHEKGENRGPCATRNLGILEARCEYVAFLDNDDVYLPDRFAATKQVFAEDAQAEGVYEAVGMQYESEESRKRWEALGGPKIIAIRDGISPESLFEAHTPLGDAGYCQLDGLTVKREVFEKTGLFIVGVRAEDTTLFAKLSACARMCAGNVSTPVALRRIHDDNGFAQSRGEHETWADRLDMWLAIYKWMRRVSPDDQRQNLICQKMLWDAQNVVGQDMGGLRRTMVALRRFAVILVREPRLLGNVAAIKRMAKYTLALLK